MPEAQLVEVFWRRLATDKLNEFLGRHRQQFIVASVAINAIEVATF